MRITIEHKRTKAEVIESVDRSFDQMFQGVSGLPVRLVTASIDEGLDANAYIVPGLGDAGDRQFGPR